MNRRRSPLLLFALFLVLPVSMAQAQAPAPVLAVDAPKGTYVSNDKVARLGDKPQGWSYNLKLGANFNVASNRDVVGQVNGNSFLMGLNVLSTIGYLHGKHEWLNLGSLQEAWSKTPATKFFVKSNDLLDIQTQYNFFLTEFTGPFVRAQIQTGLLDTYKVTETPKQYRREGTSGSLTSRRFKLSDSFQPFTLTESLGWFIQPIHSDRLNVSGRAGFGGRHTFAKGAKAINDDTATTDVIEFSVLKNVHQAGAELFAGADGKEVEGRVLYNIGATALFPLLNNDSQNRSIAKLTRVTLQASVGMGIFSWLAVNYQLKVVRDVQLIDAIQVQNMLLLSFQYALSSPAPKAAPAPFPPEAEAKIAELEARATAAEQRANKAEERAQQAEAPAPPAVAPEAAPAPAPAPAAPVAPAAPTAPAAPAAPPAPAR